MKKIGIDIDEVVCEYIQNLLEYLKKTRGIKIDFMEVYDCNLKGPLNMTQQEVWKLVSEHTTDENVINLNLVEGAKEGITSLNNEHEIIFITSRHPKNYGATKIFFDNHFPKNSFKIIFSSEAWENKNKTKKEICRENNIDIIIEDNPLYALDCANSGIKVILFDKPWNQDCTHEKIKRVSGWKEVPNALNEN